MKKLFAYKGAASAEKAIHAAADRGDAYLEALEKFLVAIVKAPINAHVSFLKFRLRMTDKYLDAKAKTCERLLKEMSVQRKKVAKEHYDARTELKAIRTRFNYPGNPRIVD